MFYLIYTF